MRWTGSIAAGSASGGKSSENCCRQGTDVTAQASGVRLDSKQTFAAPMIKVRIADEAVIRCEAKSFDCVNDC